MTVIRTPEFKPLQDQYGRIKRKLRISVTDRCNFKCQYCMPEHPEWLEKSDILSFEALYTFCELMVEQGIESIRITGGEPLMRQGVVHFIRSLGQLRAKGLARISMTSNGHYLAQYADALKQAGLDDINISLDSLDSQQFLQLTKKQLKPVLQGIAAAQQSGLKIKINTVLMKGINDDQILPLVTWAKSQSTPLRFIEYMPLNSDAHWQKNQVVTEQEILSQLQPHYQIRLNTQAHDPARTYVLNDNFTVGIISTISNSFCAECDRLRLTATGELFSCLFSDIGLVLKPLLDAFVAIPNEDTRSLLMEKIGEAVWHKQAGFISKQAAPIRKISMHALGG